jgi:hypothetical protein
MEIHPVKPLYSYKELKQKMRNLPGRVSSELEIVSEAELRRREREVAIAESKRISEQRLLARIAEIQAEAKERAEGYERAQIAWAERRLVTGLPVGTIIDACCARYGEKPLDIISDRRTKDLVYVRHIVMYLCCTLTTRSLPQIGRCLGNRDHSTILHGRDKIKAKIDKNPTFAAEIEELKRSLGVAA